MARALMEGGDLNEWLNEVELAPRLHMRTASFCFEHAPPHRDDDGFTQGLITFLPNATFLQPPGYVHSMIASSWQPLGLNVSWSADGGGGTDRRGSRWNATYSASAARSANGRTVVIRLLSHATTPTTVSFTLLGRRRAMKSTAATYVATTLAAPALDAINTAAEPLGVAPREHPPASLEEPFTLPARSFAIVTARL